MTAKQRYRDNARNEAQTRFATITGIVQTDEGRWVSVPDIFQVGFINNHVVLIGEGLHQIISMKGSSTWRTMVDRLKGWTNTNPFHAIDNLALHAVWKPRIFVPEMAFEAADGIEDHFTVDSCPPISDEDAARDIDYQRRCRMREEQAAAIRLAIRERKTGVDPVDNFKAAWRDVTGDDAPDVTDWDPALIAQGEAIRVFVRLLATLQ